MNELVALVLEETGSVRNAARQTGIHERLLQRWKNGHANPDERSQWRLRVWLDRDDFLAREERLRRYEARAAQGRPLFA